MFILIFVFRLEKLPQGNDPAIAAGKLQVKKKNFKILENQF